EERVESVRLQRAWIEREEAESRDILGRLRVGRERPCRRRTAEHDELAAFHSITSSAMVSSVGGTVRPSALAVLRLTVSSNFVGCSIGRSAGRIPCKIRSTYQAPRLNSSDRGAP